MLFERTRLSNGRLDALIAPVEQSMVIRNTLRASEQDQYWSFLKKGFEVSQVTWSKSFRLGTVIGRSRTLLTAMLEFLER